jgi:hypothetical protein
MPSAFDKPGDMMTGANNVGEGWHKIIEDLEGELNTIDPHYEILQVKEKFGGLRYYAAPSRDLIKSDRDLFHSWIAEAESRSFNTCEVCGERGTSRAGGWIKTLCDTHDAERRKERRT